MNLRLISLLSVLLSVTAFATETPRPSDYRTEVRPTYRIRVPEGAKSYSLDLAGVPGTETDNFVLAAKGSTDGGYVVIVSPRGAKNEEAAIDQATGFGAKELVSRKKLPSGAWLLVTKLDPPERIEAHVIFPTEKAALRAVCSAPKGAHKRTIIEPCSSLEPMPESPDRKLEKVSNR